MLIPCSQYEKYKTEFLELESLLRKKELIHKLYVQKLLRIAEKTYLEKVYLFAIERLKLIIELSIINETRMPDEFRPHCPSSLSRNGDLNIIIQIDGIPIVINHNKIVTGLGIFGPQGSGKSRAIIDICRKIRCIDPNIKITIIDPKCGFSNLHSFLHIDLLDASFDLIPPDNVSIEVFIYELLPILAASTGLIYGLDLLGQAADIAFEQRRQYIQLTGNDPGISLKDIYEALKQIRTTSFRKSGYHDAAVTALSLILNRQNLFSSRKGISLKWLFNQNVVLNARCLTDEIQCRFFTVYLLYWLYQQARHLPETNEIKHIVIVDDAARFVSSFGSQFDSNSKTSPLGNILAVLRSSGVCLIYTTQLPSQVDPAVLSLTRNVLVVGNINGEHNLDVIQGIMSLTNEQKAAITRFKNRETLAFISGHDWPRPIHGWIPEVNISEFTTNNPTKPVLDITPWHSLTQIPQHPVNNADTMPVAEIEIADPKTLQENRPEIPNASPVKCSVDKLVLDCIHYPFEKARDHAEQMDSFREYDAAKRDAVQNGLLIESKCGKGLYLIATQIAYDKFGVINPYKRATSIEHAFYVQLAAHILKANSELTIKIELPVGNKGQTIDVTTTDKSGNLTAYEVTLSTSNLSSNASKLQDSAYKKIIWLCRDADTAKAVTAYFNKTAALPPDFIAKFEYEFFSKWIQKF